MRRAIPFVIGIGVLVLLVGCMGATPTPKPVPAISTPTTPITISGITIPLVIPTTMEATITGTMKVSDTYENVVNYYKSLVSERGWETLQTQEGKAFTITSFPSSRTVLTIMVEETKDGVQVTFYIEVLGLRAPKKKTLW